MNSVSTEVMKRGPARFDMVGKLLPFHLERVDECISAGLAVRLVNYALERLDDAGFKSMVKEWGVVVYTMDGDEAPADRYYVVKWQNTSGGLVEVVGIMTRRGWPFLDHGYAIGCEPV